MATARKTNKKRPLTRAVSSRAKKAPVRKSDSRATKTVARKPVPIVNGKNGKTKQTAPILNQKETLQQERANVEIELNRFREQLQEAPEMTGDEVDLNVYEREKTLGLVAAYERRLEELDATLLVAAQGKYGICERCGKPIEPERLQIFPETRVCVSCKNELEREQRRLRV